MAIPQKPLVIVDYDKRTLAQHRALFANKYVIDDFFQFLLDHVDHESSWTEEEISALSVDELDEVHMQLYAKLDEITKPPLAK